MDGGRFRKIHTQASAMIHSPEIKALGMFPVRIGISCGLTSSAYGAMALLLRRLATLDIDNRRKRQQKDIVYYIIRELYTNS